MNNRPLIMGILNVTKDSFSDGGEFLCPKKALEHARKLFADGADIVDIGAFSTFFGKEVSVNEEKRRVLPLVKALAKEDLGIISVDTKSSEVAQGSLDLGASWINDQSAGLHDKNMAKAMKNAEKIVLMHHMDCDSGVYAGEKVGYADVTVAVKEFFLARIANLKEQGVDSKKLILDPGIGFGKSLKDSLTLIKNIGEFNRLGNTLLGLSRKSFLGKLLNIPEPKKREFATIGASLAAMLNGVSVLRTHNVQALVEARKAFEECFNG